MKTLIVVLAIVLLACAQEPVVPQYATGRPDSTGTKPGHLPVSWRSPQH